MKKKVDLGMIVRLAVLAVSVINAVINITGILPDGIDTNLAYNVISAVACVASSVWCAWKNNNITSVAQVTGEVFNMLKDGKITREEMDAFIANHKSNKLDT